LALAVSSADRLRIAPVRRELHRLGRAHHGQRLPLRNRLSLDHQHLYRVPAKGVVTATRARAAD
jgi:hypothetical protein